MKDEEIFYLTTILVILIDQITKVIVRKYLPIGKEIEVIKGVFSILHIQNPGALFGMFQNATTILIFSSFFVIGCIIYIERLIRLPLKGIALGLVLGGIVGNLIDRVLFRSVTDFLFVKHLLFIKNFPVFNLADAAIDIGLFLFIILYLKYGK